MTERERLLAKQIEFMSGRRSDQPIRTLDSEENAILDLPTTTSYVTVYSGHLLQNSAGTQPLAFWANSVYNPFALTLESTRSAAGAYLMKFTGSFLQRGTIDKTSYTTPTFFQNSDLSGDIKSAIVGSNWVLDTGVYRIETSFVNWNHNQETPALKDGVNGSFELKVKMAS